MLTQENAPQDGYTPLYAAASNGHLDVVKLLLEAGWVKNAPIEVREGMVGGGVGRTYGACVSFWGSQPGCWLSAC